MKAILSLLLSLLVLSGCAASRYQYQSQANPQQWQGRSVQDLQTQWGSADQVFKTRTGDTYYVYSANSTSNYFNSTTSNFGIYGQADVPQNFANDLTLQCTTVFKANATGIITKIVHQGSNCGGQWVAKPAKSKS